MLAIGIGYPLQIKDNKYEIELGSETKFLNSDESSVWLKFNGIKNIINLSDCEDTFNRLINMGALKKAETFQELMLEIENVTLVRQGAGTIIKNGNIICVGEKQVELSKLDFEVWKLSDGKMKVLEIWSYVKNTIDADLEKFLKSLSVLDEMDLIFLR